MPSPPDDHADLEELRRGPEPAGGGPRVDSPVGLAIEAFGATVESETVRE
jgi:hypothetical protein